jgi:formate dehydrogenase iron-sulfur subunit
MPENVQTIGPRDEILAQAHARAKEINGYIYGEHENGGTNTIYVSPVPFEDLDRSIQADIESAIDDEVGRMGKAGKGPGKGAGKGAGAGLRQRLGRRIRGGRPHMKPVENSMAKAENLTMALFVAPVAGAALAWHKVRGFFGGPGKNNTTEVNGHE